MLYTGNTIMVHIQKKKRFYIIIMSSVKEAIKHFFKCNAYFKCDKDHNVRKETHHSKSDIKLGHNKCTSICIPTALKTNGNGRTFCIISLYDNSWLLLLVNVFR